MMHYYSDLLGPKQLDNFQKAIKFYSNRGFEYRSLPWIVSPFSDSLTRPKDRFPTVTHLNWRTQYATGHLVGSGEQSFLDSHNGLDYEPLMGLTPCFRQENVLSYETRPYFMKLELYRRLYPEQVDWHGDEFAFDMASSAWDLFTYLGIRDLRFVITKEGYDIFQGNLELGSYGIRTLDGIIYAYGTGLAEPRITYAINRGRGY